MMLGFCKSFITGVQVFTATNRKIMQLDAKQKHFKIENGLVCDAQRDILKKLKIIDDKKNLTLQH